MEGGGRRGSWLISLLVHKSWQHQHKVWGKFPSTNPLLPHSMTSHDICLPHLWVWGPEISENGILAILSMYKPCLLRGHDGSLSIGLCSQPKIYSKGKLNRAICNFPIRVLNLQSSYYFIFSCQTPCTTLLFKAPVPTWCHPQGSEALTGPPNINCSWEVQR